MSTDPKLNAPDLNDVRKQIDRVDQALLNLIAERLALSADVRRAKAGAKLWRPSREDSHVAELVERARSSGTEAALVSRVWAELMSASISVQGSTRLHVALEGDTRANLSLIRDRFGGSLPVSSYPTSSTALAACYADPEGIAVLPAPGGMNNWWTALAPDGSMPDLKIVAGLPRIGQGRWPHAVAVADISLDYNAGSDGRVLVVLQGSQLGEAGTVRGESGDRSLIEISAKVAANMSALGDAAIIGYLPASIAD